MYKKISNQKKSIYKIVNSFLKENGNFYNSFLSVTTKKKQLKKVQTQKKRASHRM